MPREQHLQRVKAVLVMPTKDLTFVVAFARAEERCVLSLPSNGAILQEIAVDLASAEAAKPSVAHLFWHSKPKVTTVC